MASNIQFTKESAASVPVAGSASQLRVFVDDSDSKLKFKDNAGQVTPIASSAFPGVVVVDPPVLVGQTLVINQILPVGAITGSINFDLPPLAGVSEGVDLVAVVDVSGVATTYTITITPDGSDTINGSSSPLTITDAYGIRGMIKTSATNWSIIFGNVSVSGGGGGLTTVSFISDLKAVSNPLAVDRVFVRDHSIPGDGGEGTFRWVDDEATPNDDGMFITPNGHVGDGRWVREGHLGVVNAQWYGVAKVDNQDVSAQFQAAIDAATELYVPPNPFRTDYRVYNLVLKSDFRIKFANTTRMYSVFTGGDWQTCFLTGTEALSNIVIEGGEFAQFNSVWTHDIGEATSGTLINSSCRHMAITPSSTGSGIAPSFKFNRVVGFTFEQIYIGNGGQYGIYLQQDPTKGHHATVINIRDCRILQQSGAGIFSEDTLNQRSTVNITGSSVEHNYGAGIVLGGNLGGCNIKDSYLENNGITTGEEGVIITGYGSTVRSMSIQDNFFGVMLGSQTHHIRVEGLAPVFIDRNAFATLPGQKLLYFQGTQYPSSFPRYIPIVWMRGNLTYGNQTDDYYDQLYDYVGTDESAVVVEENTYSGQFGRDRRLFGLRTTSNAAPLTVETMQSMTDRVMGVKVTVIARDTVTGDSALYELQALFNNASDVVTQKGSTAVLNIHEDDPSWDVTFSVSGTNVIMQIKGDISNDVKWTWEGKAIFYG